MLNKPDHVDALDNQFLQEKADYVRLELLNLVYRARGGHIGGALSTVDLLVVLFYEVLRFRPEDPLWPERDRFVLSKGHCCEGYYVILADRGFFSKDELASFLKFQSRLAGHPHPKIPGVEVATGSLGHGLSVSLGMALAGKRDQKTYRVYTMLGDGELAEGSVWEAAMAAPHFQLDNLTCIIDANGLQISGPTDRVMKSEPLKDRWASFGWTVREIDGHDFSQIRTALTQPPVEKKPTLVIARTVKGKGFSLIENKVQWHHKVPTDEEYAALVKEKDMVTR